MGEWFGPQIQHKLLSPLFALVYFTVLRPPPVYCDSKQFPSLVTVCSDNPSFIIYIPSVTFFFAVTIDTFSEKFSLPFCLTNAQMNLSVYFLVSLYVTRQSSLLMKCKGYNHRLTKAESTEPPSRVNLNYFSSTPIQDLQNRLILKRVFLA
jgi:hypothetical protein